MGRVFCLWLFYFFPLIFLLLWGMGSVIALAQEPQKPKQVTGGTCQYRQYSGKATIVSIRKREDLLYDVKFSFFPDQEIEESWVQIEGRQYLLLLNNSSHPGMKFLKKYGIEPGGIFCCYMKVITKGSCTPILFEFPVINLTDYSENLN